jgi:hypothetical protein
LLLPSRPATSSLKLWLPQHMTNIGKFLSHPHGGKDEKKGRKIFGILQANTPLNAEPSLSPADLVLSTLLVDSFVGSVPRGLELALDLSLL